MSYFDDAMAYVDEEAVAKLTTEMIEIPSPMGGEETLAKFLEGHFQAAGLETRLQEVEENRFNVFGYLEGTCAGPTLLYLGHLDTAYGGDEEGIRDLGPGYQPIARQEGEWIYGLGAYNMKGGHAASILAVEALSNAKVKLDGDLIIAGVVGETCHTPVARYQGARFRGCGVGARFLVANGITADMAVIPEPTSNRISVASGGYVYVELITRGNPGATYRRGGTKIQIKPGEDAIEKMLKTLPALKKWGAEYMSDTTYHGEAAGHVNVIAIEGGHPFRPSKLPSFCRLYLEVGHMPGIVHGDIINAIRQVTEQARKQDPEIEIELNVIQTAHAAEISTDEFIVKSVSAAHEEVWGEKPEITWDGWYADTAPLTRAGIPSICYGPQGRMSGGGSGYYPKEGEHVSVNDLTKGVEVFIRNAHNICMQDRNAVRQPNATGTIVR